MPLSSTEQRWGATIARTFVPRGVLGGTTDALDAGPLLAEDDSHSPWYTALLLRAAIWLVWLSPLWTLRAPRTFGGLSDDDRAVLLEALLHHSTYPVRQAVNYLKLVSCSVLLGSVPVLEHLQAYRLAGPLKDAAGRRGPAGGTASAGEALSGAAAP